MSKRFGRLLVVAGVLGAAGLVAQRTGVLPGAAQPGASGAGLPLACRVRRHGWRVPRSATNTPVRVTCSRCEHIDVPLP